MFKVIAEMLIRCYGVLSGCLGVAMGLLRFRLV